MTPEPPMLQSAAAAPLVQPEPVQPEPVSSLVDPPDSQPILQESSAVSVSEAGRRGSGGIIEPPTDIRDSVITPEQLREQLPLPSFVTATESLSTMTPPTRADTPPPPPPATGLQFVNYTTQSFDSAPSVAIPAHTSEPQPSAALHWLPPNTDAAPTPPSVGSRPMSPAKKQDLPVFTANGTIPFAMSAPAPTQQDASTATKAVDYKDVWEVPDTPTH
jgi:histone deacetylase HOS3